MPVSILFYHRVADDDPNPWTISCDAFKQQVDWLANHFDLVSLEELSVVSIADSMIGRRFPLRLTMVTRTIRLLHCRC